MAREYRAMNHITDMLVNVTRVCRAKKYHGAHCKANMLINMFVNTHLGRHVTSI